MLWCVQFSSGEKLFMFERLVKIQRFGDKHVILWGSVKIYIIIILRLQLNLYFFRPTGYAKIVFSY